MDDVAELEIGKRSDDVVDVPTIKQQISIQNNLQVFLFTSKNYKI